MMNRLIKEIAVVCPTGKVTAMSKSHPQSTSIVLKQLQFKLDKILKYQYARKSQGFVDKKINSVESANNNSRLAR
jgi:hypothetical protein